MSFTVVWKPDAEDDLADRWLTTVDRSAVADAANHLEQTLATDPLAAGESREGMTRVAFEGPLGVVYDVSEADRLVTVLQVLFLD